MTWSRKNQSIKQNSKLVSCGIPSNHDMCSAAAKPHLRRVLYVRAMHNVEINGCVWGRLTLVVKGESVR